MTKGEKLSDDGLPLDRVKVRFPLALWPVYWVLTLCPIVVSVMLPSGCPEPVSNNIIAAGSLTVGAVAACRLARFGPGRVFAGALCILYSLCVAGWLIGYGISFFKDLQS